MLGNTKGEGRTKKGWRTGTLGLTVALLLLAGMLTTACARSAPDELNPTPDFGTSTNPIDASEIWEEYQRSGAQSYANDQYRNKWALIELDGVRSGGTAGIDTVAGTRVILRTPGTINEMIFNFRFAEDTEDMERGKTPKVLCNIRGTDLTKTRIIFDHCREIKP